MNFEICKKCKNKRDKYFIAISPPKTNKKGTVILSNQHCFMIEENSLDMEEFYRYREEYKRFISFDDISERFPNVAINEICPYFVEHQLSDWNDK